MSLSGRGESVQATRKAASLDRECSPGLGRRAPNLAKSKRLRPIRGTIGTNLARGVANMKL